MSVTGNKLDGGVELRLPDAPPPEQPDASPDAGPQPRASAGIYRAVWRWHFYAAAFVIPVLVTLAVSGAVYLFRPQIEPMVYGDLMRHPLPAAGARPLPLGEQVAAVEAAVTGQTVSRIVTPVEPGRTTQVYTLDTAQTYTDSEGNTSGLERVAFVNPYTGQMLGQLVVEDIFMEDLRDFHGELMAGRLGDRIVEVSSSWALILVGTGLYLWWRGREPRQRQRRSGPTRSGRPKIRNRHAAVGALSGLLVVFFVVSGLPWSGYWGAGFQKLSLAAGLDKPELADEATTSKPAPMLTKDLAGGSNGSDWATELLPVPASDPAGHAGHAGHEGHGGAGWPTAPGAGPPPIGVDAAAAAFLATAEAPHGYTMLLPEGPTGVYTFQASTPRNPHGREHVNVDQYSGRLLASYGFADYGPLAKAVTQGIALHEGRRFGLPNQLVNLAMCGGVLFLAVSGPMMWWRRRPRGALATAPRRPRDVRALRGAWVVMLALGVVFPLGGVTMLAVVALDRLIVRRIPRLAKVFASA